MVGGQPCLGLDADEEGRASTGRHTLVREVLALEAEGERAFLKTFKADFGVRNCIKSCSNFAKGELIFFFF